MTTRVVATGKLDFPAPPTAARRLSHTGATR
jgi:hypothetical protein